MIFNSLLKGTLIKRYKRFLADIRLDNSEEITAHCPNSGSMLNCSDPGSPVMVSRADNPKRKLKYTWELVQTPFSWTGINTSLTNKIVREGIENGTIKELQHYHSIRSEVKYGHSSRVDILLETSDSKCYVEIKNVSLEENGIALFPDAVTIRGQKHLWELMEMVNLGHRAVIFFAVQMNNIKTLKPADAIDPDYGRLLRKAAKNGVTVLAYRCDVTPGEIKLAERIPVLLK